MGHVPEDVPLCPESTCGGPLCGQRGDGWVPLYPRVLGTAGKLWRTRAGLPRYLGVSRHGPTGAEPGRDRLRACQRRGVMAVLPPGKRFLGDDGVKVFTGRASLCTSCFCLTTPLPRLAPVPFPKDEWS